MDWTGTVLKKSKVLKNADGPTSFIHKAINKVIENKRKSTYIPAIRFSKLPVCGLLYANELLVGSSPVHFSADWFTGIGTGIHDAFQLHFPLTPEVAEHVFGDWACTKCKVNSKDKIVYRHCTTPKLQCPQCKSSLRYSEIEVDFNGILGHIDLVLKHDDKYYLIDFKSCSQAMVETPGRFLPYPKNVMQIESYCFALEYQHDIAVDYYCLIYVSRDSTDLDNTFSSTKKRHHYWGKPVTRSIKWLRQQQLNDAVQVKKQTQQFIDNPSKANALTLSKNRPCWNLEDYENTKTGMKHAFMGRDCSYLDDCCKGKNWTRAAKDLLETVENQK